MGEAAIIGAVVVVYMRVPTSFLPGEDQGTMLVNVQLPPGATQQRTSDVMTQVENYMLKQPEVQSMVGVLGFSFSGQGQNAALAFTTLKDWDLRPEPSQSAQALAQRAFGALSKLGSGKKRSAPEEVIDVVPSRIAGERRQRAGNDTD